MDCVEVKQEPGSWPQSNFLEVKQEAVVEMDCVEVKQEPGSWPQSNCLEVKQEAVVEIKSEDILKDNNDSDDTNDPFDNSSDKSSCYDESDNDPFEEEKESELKNVEEPSKVNKSNVPQETLILNGQVVNDQPTGVTKFDFTTLANNKFVCKHCDFVSTQRRYLYKHITFRHMNSVKYNQCPHCEYKTPNSLRDHLIVRHSYDYEIQWYSCEQCDFRAKTKAYYCLHMRNAHKPIEEKLKRMKKCEHCPKMFANLWKLRKHILNIHDQKKRCDLCDHKADDNQSLIIHVKEDHADDKNREVLKCTNCSYETISRYILRLHRKQKCKALRVQCDKCPHQAPNMQALKLHAILHKEVKNESDLKYFCDKCDYKTYRWYSLHVHKLNHLKPEEIQYFYCYHCEFKAKRKDNLKKHIQNHFKKKTEFVCYICDFKTNTKVSHIAHLGKHSKEQKEEFRILNLNQDDKKEKRKRQSSSNKNKKAPLKRRKVRKNDDDENEKHETNESVPHSSDSPEQNKKPSKSEVKHNNKKEKQEGQSSSDTEKKAPLTRRKTRSIKPEIIESVPLKSKFMEDWLNTNKKSDHDDLEQNEMKGTDEYML